MLKTQFSPTVCRLSIFLGAVIFMAACGNEREVTFKSGGMTHTFSQGKAPVPKEFEKFVYPDSITTGSVSAEGDNEEQSKFLMLSSENNTDMVSKWYQDQLKKENWTVDKVQDMPKLISISAHKGDLEVNIMIAEEGSKTTISLSMGKSVDDVGKEQDSNDSYTPNKVTPPTD